MYMKQSSDLARKAASGRSGTRIYGIPKLDDANLAGSANSKVQFFSAPSLLLSQRGL